MRVTDPPAGVTVLTLMVREAVGAGGVVKAGAVCSRVWTESADFPLAFVAVKVKVHCCADEFDETVSVVVPLRGTLLGLLPDQNAGFADSEQVEAFVDEYVRVIEPPADVRVLVLMVSEAVGAGGVVGGGVVVVVVVVVVGVGGGVRAGGAPATRTLPSGYQ